jgi:hypothetical protein
MVTTGKIDDLLAAATERTILTAGTVAGELLAWLALLGAAQDLELAHADYRPGEAHLFAAWREASDGS